MSLFTGVMKKNDVVTTYSTVNQRCFTRKTFGQMILIENVVSVFPLCRFPDFENNW